MRLPKVCRAHRRVLVPLMVVVGVVSLAVVSLPLFDTSDSETTKSLALHVEVDPEHRQLVHTYVHSVLQAECQPSYTRRSLLARLPASSLETTPFLSSKDTPLPNHLFLYPPPFGFRGLRRKLEDLLKLLPDSDPTPPLDTKQECQRCVVMGNGGILRGLELGPLIDRFDTVIRLNSGPLGEFSVDVGNRTSIRMSYPEGTPHQWPDTDPRALFVAVVYKAVDLSWISAIVKRHAVPLWDWLFFWQKVPEQLPLHPKKIRILNLEVIRETSVDLLQFPPPKFRLWGWDQNVPTLGATALSLASLLCDEVSLAGFGYNLSQQGAPLHYYDRQPMAAMLEQTMHDVDRERALLSGLVREGAVSDLTGGLHCSFCSGAS